MIELSDEQVAILSMTFPNDDYGPEDAFRTQMESAARAGWDDPDLDDYDDLCVS